MPSRPTRSLSLALLGALSLAASPSLAQQIRVEPAVQRVALAVDRDEDDWSYERRRATWLEVNARAGVLSRAVTGTPVGYGHDAQGTPAFGADVRLLFHAFDCGSCAFHHGPALGFTWAPGPDFGTTDRYAWRHYVGDAAYAMRMEFPCMRGPGRRVFFTGLAGVSGAWADAGTGSADENDRARWNDRTQLADAGDHLALGWRLGANLDVHFRRLLVGVGFDLRQLYGVDTDHAQTMMLGAQLRLGFDAGFGGRRVADY